MGKRLRYLGEGDKDADGNYLRPIKNRVVMNASYVFRTDEISFFDELPAIKMLARPREFRVMKARDTSFLATRISNGLPIFDGGKVRLTMPDLLALRAKSFEPEWERWLADDKY